MTRRATVLGKPSRQPGYTRRSSERARRTLADVPQILDALHQKFQQVADYEPDELLAEANGYHLAQAAAVLRRRQLDRLRSQGPGVRSQESGADDDDE